MERNKRGISLIVLVITIIVMIVLAGAVIISLGNAGIIGKAQEAVDANNLKQVEQLAALIWSQEYLEMLEGEGTIDEATLSTNVKIKLSEQGITEDDYMINVTVSGVTLNKISTLGELISDPTVDYGKLVDYTVTVETKELENYNNYVGTGEFITYSDWQVFYEDETNGYVFLIAKDYVEALDELNFMGLTTQQTELYSIFKLGQEGHNYIENVAWMITEYNEYANTELYGSNVIGAIGAPTIELLAEGYNAFHNTTAITPIIDYAYSGGESSLGEGFNLYGGSFGYFINEKGTLIARGLTNDELYITAGYDYWLASPSAFDPDNNYFSNLVAGRAMVSYTSVSAECVNRPVVCLKSSIPAIATEDGYSLVK